MTASEAVELDRTPRPEELPGGVIHAEFYAEAEMVAAANPLDKWHRATEAERQRYATDAAITARVALAQVRSLGYESIAEYIAATEDLDPVSTRPRPRLVRPAPIGCRTAADLDAGPPPDQLAHPYCTAEGATVLYGRGGTGKGATACYMIRRLVRAGHVVMILDFEGHEREWGSRLRGLGMTDEELGRVHYRAPFGFDWKAATGSLSAVADLVRDDATRLGVTYLVVDSYSVATSNGDTMGGEAAAREFFAGLARIGLPSLVIAHVRGDSARFPDRPFGSVFVHNLARETWAVERIGDDATEAVDDGVFGPNVVSLELRNKKSNGRRASAAQFLTLSFYADGSIEVNDDRQSGRPVADLAADALADGPLTLPKIAAAILEDAGQDIQQDSLKRAMLRDPRRFEHASTGARPRPWSLR